MLSNKSSESSEDSQVEWASKKKKKKTHSRSFPLESEASPVYSRGNITKRGYISILMTIRYRTDIDNI